MKMRRGTILWDQFTEEAEENSINSSSKQVVWVEDNIYTLNLQIQKGDVGMDADVFVMEWLGN